MSRRRPLPARALAGAAVVIALAATGVVVAITSEDPASPAQTGVVRIGAPLPVRAVAPGFVGLSIEISALPPYAGTAPGALDPVFFQLLRNLAPGSSPVLRIGGDTTDWSWIPVPGMRRPRGIRYTIGRNWLLTAAALVRALHPRLILGVDLEANSRRLAAFEARALVDAVGRSSLQALEVGNEPELYGSFGWYTVHGRPVFGRAKRYGLRSYTAQFARFAQVLPSVPLAGPTTADTKWMGRLGPMLAKAPRLALVTVHRYPLRACDTPAASSIAATIPHLLAPAASSSLANSLLPAVRLANAAGLPLRVDELNSVACRGRRGVSDTFASALWVLNTLFAMARVGVSGVNIHTLPGSHYEPFVLDETPTGWRGFVTPVYYGMLMFARAAPARSKLLAVSATARAALHVWATRARDGRVRVVLINDSARRSMLVPIRIPGTTGDGQLIRLRAPSEHATSGVSLGGQSFGRTTTTGLLAGRARSYRVPQVSGRYEVELPPASAALLTLAP